VAWSQDAHLKLFTSIAYDTKLLPRFLRHYAAAGIGEFYIAAPARFGDEIEQLSSEHPITAFVTDLSDSLYHGNIATNEMRRLRSEYQRQDEWAVIVDVDEFVAFPRNISSVIASADAEEANVVRGVMYDRFSADGQPVDFAPGEELTVRYPVKTRFVRDVMRGCDHKAVVVKGLLEGVPGAEHHEMVAERLASEVLEIDHYKWTAGSVERARERWLGLKEAGMEWSIEYARALEHYETHGRFAWEHVEHHLRPGHRPCAPTGDD
jgi:Glycosyl transferase family 2